MKKVLQCLEHIYSKFIIYIPSIALAYLGIHLFCVFWMDPVNEKLNSQIFKAVKMATTLAALSFYAGYMTTHEKKKPIFYINGERFFHVAIIMFAINILQKVLLSLSSIFSSETLLSVLSFTIGIVVSFFILYALILMCVGVFSLLHVLHMDIKHRAHAT